MRICVHRISQIGAWNTVSISSFDVPASLRRFFSLHAHNTRFLSAVRFGVGRIQPSGTHLTLVSQISYAIYDILRDLYRDLIPDPFASFNCVSESLVSAGQGCCCGRAANWSDRTTQRPRTPTVHKVPWVFCILQQQTGAIKPHGG